MNLLFFPKNHIYQNLRYTSHGSLLLCRKVCETLPKGRLLHSSVYSPYQAHLQVRMYPSYQDFFIHVVVFHRWSLFLLERNMWRSECWWLCRDTAEVPEVMALVWQQVVEAGLADRQLFIHCLSDTGVMCYQGLDIALARQVRNNLSHCEVIPVQSFRSRIRPQLPGLG